MPLASPFSAGPRLTEGPKGDPAAQAIASLRGYAYQLYASGLAWLALQPGEILHLEVAKDYSVVAGEALSAVEVKDTAASTVTINSEDVLDTLDGFVDLVERNPSKTVRLRFLSTSWITQEKKKDLTPNELFVVCIRFAQTTKSSNFKAMLTPALMHGLSANGLTYLRSRRFT